MAFSMQGCVRLRSDQAKIWAALLNPEILRITVPGCQSLEQKTETAYTAVVKVKIGPINATFNGAVELGDFSPPSSVTIKGSGESGVAGSAKGSAVVRLEPDPDGCVLTYEVNATIAGKIAQLGNRMIDGVAKKLADQFFANLVVALDGKRSGVLVFD